MKLKKGEYKNYKELCENNNLEIKSGKSKQLKMKEIEDIYEVSKDGNKIIIGNKKRTNKNNKIEREGLIDLTNEDLMDIFVCSKNKLKDFTEAKNFKTQLRKEGYRLVNTYKVGNKTYYQVKQVNLTEQEEVDRKWRKLARIYKIEKWEDFKEYSLARLLDKQLEVPRRYINAIKELNSKDETLKKYDDVLCNAGILKDLGKHFYRCKKGTYDYEECTEDYYKTWHTENNELKEERIENYEDMRHGKKSKKAYERKSYRIDQSSEEWNDWLVLSFHKYEIGNDLKIVFQSL